MPLTSYGLTLRNYSEVFCGAYPEIFHLVSPVRRAVPFATTVSPDFPSVM